ncbi:hypothetical protein SAMN04488593_2115 [Microbacterium azadirachtae]|nr:hypothetical protein SAMN04488593_2115 [Microbacterium azadirachtae]SEG17156.1 hypothetical protein SAMN04488594_2064 [Microbacterium azadirachtae]SEG19699.1 hypothetical protein SAMN04488592_2074 [Microbacterium azadirachtae]
MYLDQNQWSTIGKALFAPHRVADPAERRAAVQLLTMAEAGQVIMPMSAAHLSETASWSNDVGRLELARTILAGSRGWQMRDVLAVRADEFRSTLATFAGLAARPVRPVVTVAPFAALGAGVRGSVREATVPPEIPDEWRMGYLSTLSNLVYAACLLDRESTPRGSLSGWLHRVQGFSLWLESERNRSKVERRRSARLFAAADMRTELARAAAGIGATPDQTNRWVERAWDSDDLGAPGISFFRSVMVDKMLAGARWEANDLTDLMYLCTAAGYADHVVGERRTIGLLGQTVRRLGASVRLHTKLASVVDACAARRDSV